MSFRIFHQEYNKTVWNDHDLCKSVFQSTSFNTDYKTLPEKKQRTVRMINMAIKLLDDFKNTLILPHKYILMKLLVRYIKDCYKALEWYNSIVQMNCKPRPELPFNTKDQLKITSNHIIDYFQTMQDSVSIYRVFNKPKPHDRLFFILKKLNYFLQKYLVEIKYWQILQPAV